MCPVFHVSSNNPGVMLSLLVWAGLDASHSPDLLHTWLIMSVYR